MSTPHPTISAWERDPHEGHYQAELHGWLLKVEWVPNTADRRGSFTWSAEQGANTQKADHPSEEMELAMAEAEHFAHGAAERDTHAIAAAIE